MTAALSFRILIFMVLAAGAFPLLAQTSSPSARIQGLSLSAESMFRDTTEEIVELSGQVQIVAEDRHISADKAKIHLKSRQVDLQGNVRLTTLSSTISGERILFDYESGTGVIYNGYVQSGPVMFEGAIIQKTGPEEYFVVEANYTTCTNCPATWSFSGQSIRAELGGYAYIKSPVLRVGGVPVLPLPYLIVPLKSDRQSGLLTPYIEQSSSGGFTLAQSYFWAISRSTDATFTLKNYELRGLKGLTNYRYVLDENSSGELDLAGIRDRVFKDDPRLNGFRGRREQNTDFNRWYLKYQHYQEQESGWIHRVSLLNASDLQYLKDFPKDGFETGLVRPLTDQDPSMETRVSSTLNTDTTHFSVDGSYHQNLLQGNPLAGNSDAVHRLPEISFSQVTRPLGSTGFLYGVDLNFVNFTRAGAAYDSLSSQVLNGERVRFIENTCNSPDYGSDPNCKPITGSPFDPDKDLIRVGQRLDIQPSLMYPITLTNGVDIVPKISYRETHYNFPIPDVENQVRRNLRFDLASRMSFSSIYGDTGNPRSTRYKHEIKPEIHYTVLPWIEQKTHPFFGIEAQQEVPVFESRNVSDSDLFGSSGLQFDYKDRIYDRNLITYSLTNTITQKVWVNEEPVYRQLALVKLSQSFDAWKDSQDLDTKQPWSNISLLADVRLSKIQSYTLLNHYPYHKYTNASSQVRINDEFGRFFEVGLSRLVTPPARPQDDVDISKRTEDYTFAGGLISRYLNLMGKVTYDSVARGRQSKIKSWAYIAQLKPPGDCWIITFIHDQNTDGDTNLQMGFEFNFDGIPKAALRQQELDNLGR